MHTHHLRCGLLLSLLSLAFSGAAAAQQKGEKRLYVVTYVDVFPNFTADATKALHQFAEESRKEPGSVRFEVLQDVMRTNHIMIVEVWQSRQAFDTHLTGDPSKRFREKLQPMLGSPFDERLSYLLP
jgi:quinol monooxygenase YgiN